MVISNLEYGGAQRQVVELANALEDPEFEVHVCVLSSYVPLAVDLRRREGRLHVIRKWFKFDASVVPRLARLLRQLQADLVHSFLFDADIAARLAGRLAGTAAVVGSERNANYRLKRRQLLAYRLTRGCVDLVVANSNAGAEFNRRMLGHEARRYRVVHNGVDTGRFSPGDGSAARRRLGIRPDEKVVGMFASFKRQKNHSLLFAAARRVLERRPNTRFLLVGDELYAGMHGSDEYKRRMDLLVDELGIREKCVFLGNQDNLTELYRACNVTVLPSLFEGTPNVLLESMACGVPVVATAVCDNGYIVPDGQVGYLVPLGEEMTLAERLCDLLGDETKRLQMGQRARAWVEQEFSVARLAEKMRNIYVELLEGNSDR